MHDSADNHSPVHRPPPAPVVAELVRAGLSAGTAKAMESWKATEVLELLEHTAPEVPGKGPAAPARGTI